MSKLKKNKKTKKIVKDVYIDADNIPYVVAPTPTPKKDSLEGIVVKPTKTKLKILTRAYAEIVEDYESIAAIECALQGWKLGKTYVIVSDPKTNFRYDIYPEYKANRSGREKTKDFYKLRKWAYKTHTWVKNTEADDVVAYHVRNGAIGFTIDKDLYKGVPGLWYNSHHMHRNWVTTSEEEANKFCMMQAVMGDATDNIKGIEGLGEKTVEKLLKDDYTFNRVIEIYKGINIELDDTRANNLVKKAFAANSYSKKDAVLTRRLIGMDQWTPEDGVKLFKAPKKSKKAKHGVIEKVSKVSKKKSKADRKENKKVQSSDNKGTASKRKNIRVSESTEKVQEPSSDNAERSPTGYYKSKYAHKNLISKAVYNKLSRDAQREYSEFEA